MLKMFKILVLLSLYLATVSCLPSFHNGVEKVDATVEAEQKPQAAFPVPVEEVPKEKSTRITDDEAPIDATPLKSAEPTDVAADTPSALVVDEKSANDENDDKRFLFIKLKTTTTPTTTPMPTAPEMPP